MVLCECASIFGGSKSPFTRKLLICHHIGKRLKRKIAPSIQLAYRDKRNFIKGKYNSYCFKQVELEATGRNKLLKGEEGYR